MIKTAQFLKWIFIVSLSLNLLAGIFTVRHFYYVNFYSDVQKELAHAKINTANSYWSVRRQLFAALPIKPTDIVFIGDSETDYFNTYELLPEYPIKNRGITGDHIEGVYNRLRDVINLHPQKLFFQIGTNDISGGMPLDTFKYYLARIIADSKVQSPNTEIYLQSVLPRESQYTKDVLKFNDVIESISTSMNVKYINIYSPFLKDGVLNTNYDRGDGLHLNAAGYKLWAILLRPYLKN